MRAELGGYIIADLGKITGTRGYFIGHFMAEEGYPDLRSDEIEIAVMKLPEADPGPAHFHREMTEITIVLSGRLTLIFDEKEKVEVGEGEFFVVYPGTVLQNPANEPGTKVVVIKYPSVPQDKYYVE